MLFLSQFSYCPLTWMFHKSLFNHKVNRLHKRCLHFIYNDGHSFNLRNQQEFTVRPIKTVHYGLNSLAYLGPRIWELLPNNLKRQKLLNLKLKAGYLKTAHTEFVNHISTKWALYRFVSIGFNLFIYSFNLILSGQLMLIISHLFWLFYYFISFVLYLQFVLLIN